MPGEVILGPGDTYYSVGDVPGGIDFTGSCWNEATLKPNGEWKKVCEDTTPCVAIANLAGGVQIRFEFECIAPPLPQGYVERAGASFHFHKWSKRQQIAP